MRPAKNSKTTDPNLIKNTRSIRRRPVEIFDPFTRHCTLKKDSKVHRMLKHGPLPDGDYSYLIADGTPTRYARWLLVACELEMPLVTLLILSRVYCRYIDTRRSNNIFEKSDVLREQLYGPMGWNYELQSIVDMITTLKKRGYCTVGVWRSVCGVPHVMESLEKQHDSELKELCTYFDEIFQSNIYNDI